MPKRTNWFQELITSIERSLAKENAKVIPSGYLTDRVTGEEREVDILIEIYARNDRILKVAIECVGRNRKSDVQWVEQIVSKHQDLNVDRTVLVSEKGFSEQASEKAKFLGLDTLTLEQAKEEDWKTLIIREVKLYHSKSNLLGLGLLQIEVEKICLN